MTIQQLEYILAVDKFRHFAKAAEYCNVTQPTLSAMIQKLEDELGVKIFDRSIQPVTPTSIGKRILDQARIIQGEVNQIKDIVFEEKNTIGGTLRLGILPTIAPYLLPRFFPLLKEKHPEIDLQIIEKKTHENFEALLCDEIDAAIIASQPESLKLTGEVLFYEEFVGYISRKENIFKNDIIRTSDIPTDRLWLLDEGHCFRDQLMRFCQMEAVKTNQKTYKLGSLETFMHMVEEGYGMTFIPELASHQLSPQQKELVRNFAIPRPARAITMVTHKDFIRKSLLEIINREIKLAVPGEMLSLKVIQTLV